MKPSTIGDVAKLAGVSKSTVSHVINQSRFVEEQTKQKVLKATQELDYRPSSVARSLVSKRTHTVGLLISEVSNPFYPDVIHGVEDVALTYGYNVFLCNTSYDLDRGLHFIQSLVDKQVDGVLFMSSNLSPAWLVELERHRIPSVVLDWEVQATGGFLSTIQLDFETGIYEAVNHLVELGHKHFAHVSGHLHLWTSRVRRDAFLNALQTHGINPAEVAVVEGNYLIDGGQKALTELLSVSPRPTAVFAANDLTALGMIWAARDHGLRVPEDLSIVGLDNIELAAQIVPRLTTVALPRHRIGSLAMNMLLELLDASQEPASQSTVRTQIVESSLIIRQSTAQPPK
jgi:DNA-binding LacI/PurR family transcriptional regulator